MEKGKYNISIAIFEYYTGKQMSRVNEGKKKGVNLMAIILIIILIVVVVILLRKAVFKTNNQKNTVTNQKVAETTQNVAKEEEKNVKVLEDGTKLNTSSDLSKNKSFENLEFSGMKLTCKNGITNLLCNIKNNSNTKTNMQEVNIVLLDEKGNEIYKMSGIIDEINPGESKEFNTSITADFANAYNFKIEKK